MEGTLKSASKDVSNWQKEDRLSPEAGGGRPSHAPRRYSDTRDHCQKRIGSTYFVSIFIMSKMRAPKIASVAVQFTDTQRRPRTLPMAARSYLPSIVARFRERT